MAKSTAVSSPLVSAFNNIAAFNSRTKRELPKMQSEYESFSLLIDREKNALEAINLPKKRKIKELQNLNVGGLFGNPGNLLNSFASGALDAAGLLGGMFPSKGKPGKPQKPSGKPIKPRVSGTKLKFGPLRSIGILNSIFAGLDFATGLQEGESVGEAAAGAGGSLAGGILGGMIGQALIPVPGLGFVIGSMAGDFLGGYGADRLYESTVQNKQDTAVKEDIKEQKQNIKEKNAYGGFLRSFQGFSDQFTKFLTGFGLLPKAPSSDESSSMLDNLHKGLEGENTFIQGNTGDSRGDHFHIGPDHEVYGKPEGLSAARKGAYKITKNLLSRKIPFTFTNAKINVSPDNPPDDATLQQYIEQEQNAHMSRSMGSSHGGIDIAAPKGTAIPGIKNVKEIPNGFGVQGKISGTQAFVGHGAYGSQSSPDVVKREKFASISPTGSHDIIIPLDHVPSSLSGRFPDTDDRTSFEQSRYTGADGREREHQDPAAEKLKAKLEAQGYNVAIVKPESFSSYQAYDKYIKSQSKKGVRVLPLHFDAKGSTGFMTITRPGDDDDSNIAAPINTALSEFSSSNPELGSFRTSTQGNATVNAGAASPTALVELGVMVDWEKHYGKNFTQTKKFDEFIESLSTAIGTVVPKGQIDPNATGGFELDSRGLQRAPESIRQYPSYDKPGSSTRIVTVTLPSTSSSGGVSGSPSIGGGGGSIQTVPGGISDSTLVNSLMKKIFLTNLNDT